MSRLRLFFALLALFAAGGCSDLTEVLTSDYEYGQLEVVAERRNGEPIPGVELTLHSGGRPMGYGTTGADGRFVFQFVPQGEYGLFATPSEPYVARPTTNIRDQIRIAEGEAEAVGFTFLKRGPGAIEARVVDSETGDLLPGAQVTLYNFRGALEIDTTGADGSVRFDAVPFGEYGVSVDPPLFYVVEPGRGTSFVDGIVVDQGSLRTLQFAVTRCEGGVLVRVRLPDGAPAPGVNAVLYTFAGVLESGRTDEQGALRFGPLPCGEYAVSLRPTPGYRFEDGRGTSYVDGLQVTDENTPVFEATVEACRGQLTAVVRDASGASVADARLTLYTYLGIEAEVTTGADGTYRFDDVPCFQGYGLSVDPPAGYTVEPGKGSSYFDGIDVADGTEQTVRFQLTRTP